MNEQFSLFDDSAPHNKTHTSIEAAIEIQPHLNRLEKMVLDAIKDSGKIDETTEKELKDAFDNFSKSFNK